MRRPGILSLDSKRRRGMKQRIGSKLNYHPPDTRVALWIIMAADKLRHYVRGSRLCDYAKCSARYRKISTTKFSVCFFSPSPILFSRNLYFECTFLIAKFTRTRLTFVNRFHHSIRNEILKNFHSKFY